MDKIRVERNRDIGSRFKKKWTEVMDGRYEGVWSR